MEVNNPKVVIRRGLADEKLDSTKRREKGKLRIGREKKKRPMRRGEGKRTKLRDEEGEEEKNKEEERLKTTN